MTKKEQLQELYIHLLPSLNNRIRQTEGMLEALNCLKDTAQAQDLLMKHGMESEETFDRTLQAVLEIVDAQNITYEFVLEMLTSANKGDKVVM